MKNCISLVLKTIWIIIFDKTIKKNLGKTHEKFCSQQKVFSAETYLHISSNTSLSLNK